jgi:hypothetical protein
MAVVQQAIQNRCGQHGVPEDLSPLLDAAIRGEQHRAAAISAEHQLEE